jgi:mono/diheme cytochrome c family protein
VLAVAGCGGTASRAPRSDVDGGQVFATDCSSCHTLTGHDTSVQGGDLAVEVLSTADIESFVHVMPVHLTPAKAAAVAAYVHREQARLAR